jgi:hypothetical protein
MAYTLGQAAKASGRSKTAIAQAITDGRISATKDDVGRWQIDPSELHRVYPPIRQPVDDSAPLPDTDRTAEVERLKATVEGLERLCRQIEGERDSLRDQNTRLTALLTDQRTKPAAEPKRRSWFGFGKQRDG